MKERTLAEIGPLRHKLQGRLMERTGLSMDAWMKARYGKPRGHMNKLLRCYLGKETYPRETSKVYQIIKALEAETGLKLCG